MKNKYYKKYRQKKKRLRSQADKLWAIAVFKEWDKRCICGNIANSPHHFFPKSLSPALRFEVSNGVPLCMSCHFLHHFQADPSIHATIIEVRGKEWYQDLIEKSRQEVKQNLKYYQEVIKKLNDNK